MRHFTLLLSLGLCITLRAQDGTPDPTFSGDGIATIDVAMYSDLGLGILQQPDGKILCAGYGINDVFAADLIVARFNADGTPDNTFGGDGTIQSNFGNDTRGRSIALQPDGKVIIGGGIFNGGTSNDFMLVRYNSDGALDNTFGGGDGIATLDIGGSDDSGYGCLMQPDGKILLAGKATIGGSGRLGVARFNADGTPDLTFNGTGWSAPDPGGAAEGRRLALQGDGKIVACGFKLGGGGDWDALAERFNADGTVDATFANAGIFAMALGAVNDYVEDIAVQSDGKILLGGSAQPGTAQEFAVVRLNTDGTMDTGFDGDGIAFTAVGTANDGTRAILVQGDGKIIVAGQTSTGGDVDFGVVRYNADGSLDNTFSGDGITNVNVGGMLDYGTFAALQSDGKILLCGYSDIANDPLCVVRLNNTFVGIEEPGTNTQRPLVFPNPAGDQAMLEFTLVEGGIAKATLLDAQGRWVKDLFVEHLAPGPQRVPIDLASERAGSYVVELGIGSRVVNVSLMRR